MRRQEGLQSRGETDKQVTPQADQNIHSFQVRALQEEVLGKQKQYGQVLV